ncbi:hypothetical protein JCM13664_11430 [Methylothermus subterraneus]
MNKRLCFLAALAATAPALAGNDFGDLVDNLLRAQSLKYFGIVKPLATSAPETSAPTRQPGQAASDQLKLAPGLSAKFLTRSAAHQTDMMVFWPDDIRPTHLFTAVEVFSPSFTDDGRPQPCVQRIDLATGQVDVVLRGGLGCDPIRRTAWGTLIVGEEVSDGAVYEIMDPVNVTEAVITDRASGAVTDSRVTKRPALGLRAWEGIGLLANGVMYMGDELRPGDAGSDRDGGTIYKFVPQTPFMGPGPIGDLSQSPLAAGNVYALQVSSREATASSFPRFGQGAEVGVAAWVKIDPVNARQDAHNKGATGYYRPEDLEIDPAYVGEGVRFCWANTQREDAESYAEVLCAIDRAPYARDEQTRSGRVYLAQGSALATVSVSRFIEGNPEFNSFDNLAFQPGTGILYVVEDHDNGDVWGCLPDGEDVDLKSDGCIRVLSLVPSEAEPTGLFFSPDGQKAYLSIMHTDDAFMPKVNGWPTDDIVEIEGFRILPGMRR